MYETSAQREARMHQEIRIKRGETVVDLTYFALYVFIAVFLIAFIVTHK